MTEELERYGYEELYSPPVEMFPWGMTITKNEGEIGSFVIIDVAPSNFPGTHMVEVLDEAGKPLRGALVVSSHPGGAEMDWLKPLFTNWPSEPPLTGQVMRTPISGLVSHNARHETSQIWVHHLNSATHLVYPSDVLSGCKVKSVLGSRALGICVTFQLRRPERITEKEVREINEDRLVEVEETLSKIANKSGFFTIEERI